MKDDLFTREQVVGAIRKATYGLAGKIPKKYLPWAKKQLRLIKAELDSLEPQKRKGDDT